jgi:hypothetical protein
MNIGEHHIWNFSFTSRAQLDHFVDVNKMVSNRLWDEKRPVMTRISPLKSHRDHKGDSLIKSDVGISLVNPS